MIELTKHFEFSYSVTAICGLASAFLVYLFLGKRRQVHWWQLFCTFIYGIIGVFIGSHLLYFLVGLPGWLETYSGNIHSLNDFIDAFVQGSSGLVFYGGLLGAMAAVYISCRANNLYMRSEFNNVAVIFPLFHFFGRIGCLFTGCCYGLEYHGPLAVHYGSDFIVNGVTDDIADFSRFPVQLLEALLELALFFVLLTIYTKTKDRYSITAIYLCVYSIIRFSDEFLRGDAIRGIWGPFSTSQWISLAILVCVIIWYFTDRAKTSKFGSSGGSHDKFSATEL